MPPETREALVLLKVQVNPVAGETTEENVTEPLNPSKPARAKLATPVPPGAITIAEVFAGGPTVMEKSGLGTVRTIES